MSVLFTDFPRAIGTLTVSVLAVKIVFDLYKSKKIINLIKRAFDIYSGELEKVDSIVITIVKIVFRTNPVFLGVVMLMSSGTFLVVEALAKQISDAGESTKDKKTNTIVGVMLLEKAKKGAIQQLIIILCVLFYTLIAWLTESDINPLVLLFLFLLLLAIFLDQKLMELRIRKGWYGSNEFETRELIEFISLHSNMDDFSDGNGAKRIIPNPEIDLVYDCEKNKESVGL